MQPGSPRPAAMCSGRGTLEVSDRTELIMKTCKNCGLPKSPSDFYVNKTMADGLESDCKECRKQKNRSYYYASLEQRHRYEKIRGTRPDRRAQLLEKTKRQRSRVDYKHKVQARSATQAAIKRGELVRKPCEICGDPLVEAHHRDYSKPLNVQWLCLIHHREAHGQIVTASKRK